MTKGTNPVLNERKSLKQKYTSTSRPALAYTSTWRHTTDVYGHITQHTGVLHVVNPTIRDVIPFKCAFKDLEALHDFLVCDVKRCYDDRQQCVWLLRLNNTQPADHNQCCIQSVSKRAAHTYVYLIELYKD